ncbi:MAG: hypothetical protein AAFU86_00355 [Pseudomonadota bacterium]
MVVFDDGNARHLVRLLAGPLLRHRSDRPSFFLVCAALWRITLCMFHPNLSLQQTETQKVRVILHLTTSEIRLQSRPFRLPPSQTRLVATHCVSRGPDGAKTMDISTTEHKSRGASRPLSSVALAALSALMLSVSAMPASADGLLLRKGFAAGENGVAARSRGVVSNGEGQGAFRRGGFASNGSGNGVAGFGRCANGVNGSACRGGSATWQDDGALSRTTRSDASGENGSFASERRLDRSADGAWTGNRSTEASGISGSYSGAAALDDGTYNRDGTYTGDEGQSANVVGTYEHGSGGSRTVTCIDATGAVVDCP